MTSWLRGIWRLLRVAVHLAHGMALIALSFASRPQAEREALVQWWSQKLLRVMGVGFACSGQARAGATLLIANHVSWLDIACLHAACPQARFVSKADVLRWPLLGWLIRSVGTLFIERERKRDALRVVHQMAESLRQGDTLAIFPEGTTGPGPELLPFHANLLQAAIAVQVPVQPAVLRYFEPVSRFSVAAQYIGDTTLVQSIWRIVSAPALSVQVDFLPAVATAHSDRRALSDHLHAQIQAHLQLT